MPAPAARSAAAADRLRRLLPGVWLGWMLGVALLATPSAFALLPRAEAGHVVARVLAGEAYTAVALGLVLLVLERFRAKRQADVAPQSSSQFSAGMVFCLASLFCTVAGYFAVLPLMESARAGRGALGFGQLHAVSATFFLVRLGCVAALAWRATGATRLPSS